MEIVRESSFEYMPGVVLNENECDHLLRSLETEIFETGNLIRHLEGSEYAAKVTERLTQLQELHERLRTFATDVPSRYEWLIVPKRTI